MMTVPQQYRVWVSRTEEGSDPGVVVTVEHFLGSGSGRATIAWGQLEANIEGQLVALGEILEGMLHDHGIAFTDLFADFATKHQADLSKLIEDQVARAEKLRKAKDRIA
jgi:hypothetical protein